MSSSKHALVALHHVWRVENDGTIHVTIEQYDSVTPKQGQDGGITYGKLLKKRSLVLKDFAPILWTSANEKKLRLVIRLTPTLREPQTPQPIGQIPIAGKDITVKDNSGFIWTEHVTIKDKFIGIITHRGAILISYYPFKGARTMGTANGNRIHLELAQGKSVSLISQTAFLPEGVPTTVYAQFRPELKTSKLTSTQLKTSSKEAEFLASIEG